MPHPTDSQKWITELEITTRPKDRINAANGSIAVTLNSPTDDPTSIADDYTVANPGNLSTITVQNADLPVITIEAASETLAGRTAKFRLSTDLRPLDSLMINYIPENTGTGVNFLAIPSSQRATSEALTFDSESGNPPFTAILEVPTIQDQTNPNAPMGTFTVELVAVANSYIVSDTLSERKQSVTVIKVPIPELSIAYKGTENTPIFEGTTATFTISTTTNPKRELDIKFTPTNETNKNFLKVDSESDPALPASGQMRTAKNLTFMPNSVQNPTMWTAEIEIKTDDDGVDEAHGSISC